MTRTPIDQIEPPLHRPRPCPACREQSWAIVDGRCLRCRTQNALCHEPHPIDGDLCLSPAGHASTVHAADGKAWETTTDPKDTR